MRAPPPFPFPPTLIPMPVLEAMTMEDGGMTPMKVKGAPRSMSKVQLALKKKMKAWGGTMVNPILLFYYIV